ncbi:MAG: right-handed parallel beta-helix repeat-containing protein [Nitrospirae bacterium]|nr:right-handed parallel beta-helix repeat-containing protein [Nitrospirota bacterium]
MKFLETTFLLLIIFILFPFSASGITITRDTVWKGEITLSEDIVVPEGVTLTILSGTVVNIIPSDRTKSEAEYLLFMTEMTIRGRLEVEGTGEAPVVFQVKEDKPYRWAGIIIDGGEANIKACRIYDAETGLLVMNGSLGLTDSVLEDNRYGIVAQGAQTFVNMKNTYVQKNDHGVFSFAGANVDFRDSVIEHNMKNDLYMPKPDSESLTVKRPVLCNRNSYDFAKEFEVHGKETSREYGDEVLPGDTVWRGRIAINGLLRVPVNFRLIIAPGTVVEFKKKDTNGDGIGENGILMQGVLIAKGTKDEPIIFRSAEKQKRPGDWDAINIMNSDGAQNLVEFCQIENAYRGLHFHFSNVMVSESILRNNYIGIQFQESAAEIRGSHIYGNKNGIKGRDSDMNFTGNYVFDNINGVNLFRVSMNANDNTVLYNMNDGFKIREGITALERNFVGCNRSGLMVNDAFHGRLSNNAIVNNYESGMSLKGVDNLDISGNFIQGNGVNGINLQNAGAVIKGNYISENGERGIGIQSFTGTITENNIAGNGLYAVENESGSDISAPSNWWGNKDAASVIYDNKDRHERGEVLYSPEIETPLVFSWPLKSIYADVTWPSGIYLNEPVTVYGSTLEIAPGANIIFSKGAGLKVSGGKMLAPGTSDKRIVFTSSDKNEASLWDEILFEHADGSEFSFCDFEYATWAIHSHFTSLKISNSRFLHNEGGIRFRSGPVEINRSLFRENKVGIRSYFGNALIEENVILNNDVGIFVREKGSGLTIKSNNIYSNKAYNVRVGDFNTEDIDARKNWWGVDDPAVTIFDARCEPGIGEVIYEPYLTEPVKLNGVN